MKRLLILLIFSGSASAADYTAWVGGEHITDDQDAIVLGLTIEWSKWELDLAHGQKRMKWRAVGEPWQMDEWQSGSAVGVRWYPLDTNSVRPFITWNHSSDITRGKPFNDTAEPTADFFGVGVSYRWKRLEFQAAFGKAARECALFNCSAGAATNEILIRLRGHFWSR